MEMANGASRPKTPESSSRVLRRQSETASSDPRTMSRSPAIRRSKSSASSGEAKLKPKVEGFGGTAWSVEAQVLSGALGKPRRAKLLLWCAGFIPYARASVGQESAPRITDRWWWHRRRDMRVAAKR